MKIAVVLRVASLWLLTVLLGSEAGFAEPYPVREEPRLLGAPQDFGVFAARVGPDIPLMSAEEQARRDRRATELFFGPWTQARPSVSGKAFRAALPRKARGYHLDKAWTPAEWAQVVDNANEAGYPSARGPAIVTRHTDLRSMPTAAPLYLEATPTPEMDFFDFFQQSSLPWGTPVYISHTSRDRAWVYVEYPLLSGWARAEDVTPVTREVMRAYRTGTYGVGVKDQVRVRMPGTTANQPGEELGLFHVGSLFPLVRNAEAATGEPGEMLVPVRTAEGTVRLERVRPPVGTVESKPIPLTAGALARIGNGLLGQPYAWGGSGHNRDCSLALRDLFAPFGLWLPRNSRAQVRSGNVTDLAKLSPVAREATLVRKGKPFLTLLGFPGHVGLYVGEHEGRAVMFHNILGLRTTNPDEFFRHIIGRGILSVLEPGTNMPEVELSETLLERMNAMRLLP